MKKNKKVAIYNLGCKVNSYEAQAIKENLEENGYQMVDFKEVADVYIVNTCTVTNIASSKSRQMLSRGKKINPKAIIVAIGCYVHIMEEEQIHGIDIMIGNNKKQDLVEILDDFFMTTDRAKEAASIKEVEGVRKGKTVRKEILDMNQKTEYEKLSRSKTGFHTRENVKIQDGCNQFCSYCIVPIVRGRARSRPIDDVIREVNDLSEKGCKEVVLTGINLSSYGEDLGQVSLLGLIEEIHKVSGLFRIRLGSLEPRLITTEFVKALSSLEKFCPHFHLSLQSGCDEILKKMNRQYTTKEYYEKCQLIREYFSHPSITTDIIVGFPGETEKDFLETKSFVERVGFHETHIFKYSRREGTKAAKLPIQCSNAIKSQRSKELIQLGKLKKKEFERYYLGKEVEVLVEGSGKVKGKEVQVGHTKEYVKILVNNERNLQNQVVFVKIIKESQFVH